MAQYQMAIIYSRTGKPDDAVKVFRTLADKQSALVPRRWCCWNLPCSAQFKPERGR